MPTTNGADVCDVCGRGIVVRTMQEIAFRQWTSKGYVSCRVTIPVGICGHCGARNWDEAAESVMENAVKDEMDKLP